MQLLPAGESKLAPHPRSRRGLHNAAYESKIAQPCQPVGRPGWRGKKKKGMVSHHLIREGRKGAVREKA